MTDLSAISTVMVRQRARVLAKVEPARIQSLEPNALLELQTSLGYGDTWGYWEAPEEWCAKGPNSRRRIHCDSVGTEGGNRLWTETLRCCLLLSLTRGIRNYAVPLSVCIIGRLALKLGQIILAEGKFESHWWGRISTTQALQIGSRSAYLCEVITTLCNRGLLPDAPRAAILDINPLEIDHANQNEPANDLDRSRPWLPLPDGFTAECGRRVLWIVEHLGPAILDCLDACKQIELPPSIRRQRANPSFRRSDATARVQLARERNRVIEDWAWLLPENHSEIPFAMHLCDRIGFGSRVSIQTTFQWPPTKWGVLIQLARILQTCHLWLLFLASGPRHSTILSYTAQSLIFSPSGYRVEAIEYKQRAKGDGHRRDWPLAPAMVIAMKQQIRLAGIVKRLGPSHYADQSHLWVQFRGNSASGSDRGGPLQHLNSATDDLVDAFDLRALLGGATETLHTHRFRETLARILALTLTSAQTILMDCFGHGDAEVTLGYMLSDPRIVSDALRVQKELVILMARDAIIDSENLGGQMGEVVRKAKHRVLRLKRTSCLTPEDAYELADQLTLGGREWMYVMEGVICTLPQLEQGPCGVGCGSRRNPANCQPGCSHQLILAHFKNQTNDMIEYLIGEIVRAEQDGATLLIATLAGQLRNHLHRWPDVRNTWLNHSVVQRYGGAN